MSTKREPHDQKGDLNRGGGAPGRGESHQEWLKQPEPRGVWFAELRSLGAVRLAEIERIGRDFVARRGPFEAIDPDTLARRLRAGDVVLLDVRPEDEFRAGHIPGAVSVPLRELEAKLGAAAERLGDRRVLPRSYCLMSLDAVEVLSAHGFRARRLEDGVLEWRGRGHSVARARP